MAESFSGDWLALREPHDAASRNPVLAERLAAALPGARPTLLDLGAGTGSLLRWLAHFVGRPQGWILADRDPELVARAFDETEDAALAMGWRTTWPGKRTLLVHTPTGAWRIEAVLADLARAPDGLPLHKADAVVCSALCDLVSEGWVARIAAACAARRLPFYAALNVTGRARFAPPHPGDAWVARGFARDQHREKGFGGAALGEAAPAALARAFAALGYEVLRAPSPWRIPRQAGDMAAELAEGHALAALACEAPREHGRIRAWLEDRLDQADALRLSATVPHEDVLCLPPSRR